MTQCTQEEALTANQDCILEAVTEVFSSTCGVAVKAIEMTSGPGSKIVSVISLVGDVEWSLYLGLPQDTAGKLAAKFAGFEIPFDSPDMGDAVGEITNILAGNVKARLDRRGVKADISLPSVMRVDSLEVLSSHTHPMLKSCYESELGLLWTGLVAGKSEQPAK